MIENAKESPPATFFLRQRAGLLIRQLLMSDNLRCKIPSDLNIVEGLTAVIKNELEDPHLLPIFVDIISLMISFNKITTARKDRKTLFESKLFDFLVMVDNCKLLENSSFWVLVYNLFSE